MFQSGSKPSETAAHAPRAPACRPVIHPISKAHPGAIARKLSEFVFKFLCELPIFTVFFSSNSSSLQGEKHGV